MTAEDIIGLILSGTLSLFIIVLACFLIAGKGANLIAGYNTMSKEEKEKYDAKKLCRFIGKILLPIGIMMPFVILFAIKGINWFSYFFIGVTIFLIVFAIIYTNGKNRFKK